MDLERAFIEALRPHVPEVDAVVALRDLWRIHTASDRGYHDWQHVTSMQEDLALFEHDIRLDVPDLRVAIAFHDSVYDPRRSDNEAMSVLLMRDILPMLPETRSYRIGTIIMATDHKRLVRSREEEVIVDLDLAILAASPERYAEYVAGVRKEYAFVAYEDWRKGRSAVLRGFLARPFIFVTPEMAHREGQARTNLEAELKSLAATPEASPSVLR